ncbi:MAG TPA: protein kinase [Streptosporangiaceae bacterium]
MTQDVYSGAGGLAPGDRLAGYLIQDRIGRGGMAVVYRATDLRLGRTVALKVLSPRLGDDDAFRQRFIRESRAAAGVDHPHIVPVFEAGEAAGMLFIVMRYVDRGDIRRLIQAQGWLSPKRTAVITTQVAAALDAAHAQGLVHRDVKPGNILLTRAGDGSDHAYLSDFGLSKHSVSTSTLTAAGQFLGTLDYVSPEQIQGNHVDGRADQYALACTVVEMLTGQPPFHRDDNMQLMWAQLEEPPPSLLARRPDLPPAVDHVLAAALDKSPGGRYPTCAAFAASLAAACGASRAAALPAGRTQGASGSFPARHAGPDGRDQPASARQPRPPGAEPGYTEPGYAEPTGYAARSAYGERSAYAERPAYAEPAGHGEPGYGEPTGYAGRPGYAAQGPGTGQEDFSDAPPTAYDDLYRSGRQTQAGSAGPPGGPRRGRRSRPRKQNQLLAAVTVVVGVLAIAFIGYKIFHHSAPAAATPPAHASTQTGPQLAPAATVRAYFTAINRHRYAAAWRISGEQESLSAFTAGLAGTKHDTIKILGTNGQVVSARLVATQTDGSVKKFSGTYTVSDGKIVKANIQQTS